MKPLSYVLCFAPLVASLGVSAVALADVRKEGAWPAEEPTVCLALENAPRRAALRKLAEAAGWSLIMPGGLEGSVDLSVTDQPADRVLAVLLEDGRFIARREGNLVSIKIDPATPPAGTRSPEPSLPAAPPPPPVAAPVVPAAPAIAEALPPAKRPSDRSVTGGSARIGAHETVRDVQVLGGSLDVEGTVTGDIEVFGGSVRVHKGAKVAGDISALGGAVSVDEGAEVKGGVEAVGAVVSRRDAGPDLRPTAQGKWLAAVSQPLARAGSAVSSAALLFVFGAVLVALLTRRMEALRVETAARPMRTFAVGVVGTLAALALLIAMCVTIIGIPIALAGVVVGVLLAYGGVCAVLQTAGEALLRHRTENPYVHLAVGCALFLIASSLPLVGGYLTAVVVLLGVGAVVSTRVGRAPSDYSVADGAYRTAA